MKRSKHSLSFQRLQSMNMGYLYPTGFVEVLPGDSMRFAQSAFCRFSPLVNPVMARIDILMYRFFVPYRILWENFEEMITGGPSNDSSATIPQITVDSTTWQEGGLMDYLGVGNPGTNSFTVSALPFRAYNMVWNEFFRDQDLQVEAAFETGDTDQASNFGLLPVCWNKDYFTIARPWALKGDAVSIPVMGTGGTVSVSGSGTVNITSTGDGVPIFSNGTQTGQFQAASLGPGQGGNVLFTPPVASNQGNIAWSDPKLTGTVTINSTGDAPVSGFISPDDLRLAMSMQRFGENRARFGSRYSEYLRMLGIRPQDARLQLPEYCGGGMSSMQLSEVIQTAPTEGAALGTLGGHGVGVARSRRTRHFFPEHGVVIFLAALRPRSLYTNSVPRTFLRKTKFDFWQPELQHIGQQEITNLELNASNQNPTQVFGYSDRYNEYRFNQSQVCGEFRSLLQDWHLGRVLPNNTTLNADFVTCQPRTDIFAVTDTDYDKVYCSFSHSIQARRLITQYAKPSLR